MRLIRFLAGRVLQAVVMALGISAFSFALMQALPGDIAFRVAAARYGIDLMSARLADSVRMELGLDQAWFLRLGHWLWQLLSLDFGRSLVTGRSVMSEVGDQLGHSLVLALSAITLTVAVALPVGGIAGVWAGRWPDRLSLLLSTIARTLPTYAVAILLLTLFAAHLRWLPAAGFDGWKSIVLPAVTLAIGTTAVASRVARDSLVEVSAAAWFRYARYKGLSEPLVVLRHGVRNALIPVVAVLGQQTIVLIEGVVVVESLFSYPGIGQAVVRSVFARDVPMIQGTALALGMIFVGVNTVVDGLCAWLDPTSRTGR